MLRSMTAFSRLSKQVGFLKLSVQLQSVNGKHLHVSCNLPQQASEMETDLRSLISKFIQRGQLQLSLHVEIGDESSKDIEVSAPLVKKLSYYLEKVSRELGYDTPIEQNTLFALAFKAGAIAVQSKKDLTSQQKKAIISICQEAIKKLILMKEREGKQLQKEFSERCKELKKLVDNVEKRTPEILIKHKMRLVESLKKLSEQSIPEELIAKEAAYFTDKVDISEEISRFRYHLKHLEEHMQLQSSSGKLIEFILQELLREANTMGSKASDALLVTLVVHMKAEIEKLREQVQNVE